MPKPISYKNIQTREELMTRVENGVLSVGVFLHKIGDLLSPVQTETHLEKITVKASGHYGTYTKEMWI